MAEVTSKINQINIDTSGKGSGAAAFKKTVFTATKVTGPTGTPPKYKTEIVKYSDAKGTDPVTIGTRDDNGKITFNDNASSTDKKGSAQITKASTTQMNSPEIQEVASNASQKEALNGSAGQKNKAQGDGDDAATSGTSSKEPTGGSTTGKIGKAIGRMKFPDLLVFPTALTSAGTDRDVIRFNMMKYMPSGFGKGTDMGKAGPRKKGEIIGSVVLPVPGGISDANMADWSNGTMTPMQAAGANIALSALDSSEGAAEGAARDAGAELQKAIADPSTSEAIKATIAGAATGLDAQVMQRGAGAVMNPNMELLFNGPQLRNFGFTFKLSPRDAKEAQTVIKILRFFKQGMAPMRTEEKFFLKAPHTFELKYQGRGAKGDQPYLNKFKECALTNCGVQYTPDGNYNTFSDGVMTSYSMQLTFNELTPIYNDDYTNLDGNSDTMIGY